MADEDGHGEVSHRARQSVGKRLQRKLLRKVARRGPEWRDFLIAEGSPNSELEMAGDVSEAATAPRALGYRPPAPTAFSPQMAGGSPVPFGSLRVAICTLAR